MKVCISIILLFSSICVSARSWQPDILKNGFEMSYVDQGIDYSGKVRSTIIRRLSPTGRHDKAVLYIHGFNDYFFQTEMALKFNSNGYNFYAVDLRKYGRSIMPGQKKFQVRNFDEYVADVDSAIAEIKNAGVGEIILAGHSTGGLVASYYMVTTNNASIDALILNSPFLDWNLGDMESLVPLVSFLGKFCPDFKIEQGDGTAYSESLLKDGGHGEWHYDTNWKLRKSPDVDAGWVRAVDEAQRTLRKHVGAIKIPILLMYSSKSAGYSEWAPGANKSDIVLDVNDIKHYGLMLGPKVNCTKVVGGVHDLILSSRNVREPLYDYIFKWLSTVK